MGEIGDGRVLVALEEKCHHEHIFIDDQRTKVSDRKSVV